MTVGGYVRKKKSRGPRVAARWRLYSALEEPSRRRQAVLSGVGVLGRKSATRAPSTLHKVYVGQGRPRAQTTGVHDYPSSTRAPWGQPPAGPGLTWPPPSLEGAGAGRTWAWVWQHNRLPPAQWACKLHQPHDSCPCGTWYVRTKRCLRHPPQPSAARMRSPLHCPISPSDTHRTHHVACCTGHVPSPGHWHEQGEEEEAVSTRAGPE